MFFKGYGEHRDLHVLTHSFPARRAADLPTARVMIVGQAPGTRVHLSGIPWNDASGRRLRDWLDMADDTFYDASRIAIVPMGRSEEHTSELQSLMRISYSGLCLIKKNS